MWFRNQENRHQSKYCEQIGHCIKPNHGSFILSSNNDIFSASYVLGINLGAETTVENKPNKNLNAPEAYILWGWGDEEERQWQKE